MARFAFRKPQIKSADKSETESRRDNRDEAASSCAAAADDDGDDAAQSQP